MADPYAGIATPVSGASPDPYGAIARPVSNQRDDSETWGQTLSDSAKQFGHGVYRGVRDLARLPGQIEALPANAAEWITGQQIPEWIKRPTQLPARAAGWALDKAGVTAHRTVADAITSADAKLAGDQDQPTTDMGRYAGRIGEVAGSAIIPETMLWSNAARLAAMAPRAVAQSAPLAERAGAWLSNTLRATGQQIVEHPGLTAAGSAAASASSGIAQQAAADKGYGPVGQTVAGLAGSFAPGVAISMVPSRTLANRQLSNIESYEAAARRLGVRPFMPAASEAPSTGFMANMLANRPIVGAPIQNAVREVEQDLANSAGSIANRMSSSGDVQSLREMGDRARHAAERFKTAGISSVEPETLRAIGVHPMQQSRGGLLVSRGAQKAEASANAARQSAGEHPQSLNPMGWQRRTAGDMADTELQAIIHRPAEETSFGAKSEAMYELARRQLPNALRSNGTQGVDLVATPNTAAVLTNIRKSAANDISGQRVIRSGIADRLVNQESNFSLPNLWAIRTEIGRAIGEFNPAAPGSLRMSELRQLYGAISDDIAMGTLTIANRAWTRTQLPATNPSYLTPDQARQASTAARSLQLAQRYYRSGMGSIDRMNRVLGADTPEAAARTIVAAAQSGTNGNLGLLLSMRRSMRPAEWRDVSATIFQELGRPNAGDHAGQALGYSLSTAARRWNAMSPAAKAALFGGQHAQDVNDFFNIIGSMARYGMGRNTSNTANHLLSAELITGLGGAAATGTLPFYAGGLAGGAGLSAAMASPSALSALRQWARFKAGMAGRGFSMEHPEAARAPLGMAGRGLRQLPAFNRQSTE